MLLDRPGAPLRPADIPRPSPGPGQLLIRVEACGVCRTDLHVADGELPEPKLPLVLGHEIVGTVETEGTEGTGATGHRGTGAQGTDARTLRRTGEKRRRGDAQTGRFKPGDRVGVPWLGWTCGACRYCTSGRENLCDGARFTGYQLDGGYAEYALADQRFVFPVPEALEPAHAAPLLCAGLIGYRSLKAAGDAGRIGLYGFGAAAHIVTQVARWQGRQIFAFTRTGDEAARRFALELGCEWAGPSDSTPPEPLDAAIIYAPSGSLLPAALRATAKGGTVVCAGIHMSDIPSFPYHILWGERVVRSVANLTRKDGEEFLALAPRIPVQTQVEPYRLVQANEALARLRAGEVRGAAVLLIA
jgi:propanol-preferring alcohol dehydrogenase